MASIETPSRIWRRIEANEAQNSDMPSLPSLPSFDITASKDLDHSYLPPEDPSINLPPDPPKRAEPPAQRDTIPQKNRFNAEAKSYVLPDQVALPIQPTAGGKVSYTEVSPSLMVPNLSNLTCRGILLM